MSCICLHTCNDWLAFCNLTCRSLDKMGKEICWKFLFQSCPVDSIKRDPLHWNSFLCVDKEVTPWGSTGTYLALHLIIIGMIPFNSALSINSLTKKFGSWHASSGVTWFFVSGNFSSASPKQCWQQTTKLLLRTFTEVFWVNMIFSVGSFLIPHSTYFEVNGFRLMRSAAKFSQLLFLFKMKSNFEAVSLNLHSFFYCSDDDWSLVASSILFIMASSTTRELTGAFSATP